MWKCVAKTHKTQSWISNSIYYNQYFRFYTCFFNFRFWKLFKKSIFVFIFDFNKTVWSWNCKLWNYSRCIHVNIHFDNWNLVRYRICINQKSKNYLRKVQLVVKFNIVSIIVNWILLKLKTFWLKEKIYDKTMELLDFVELVKVLVISVQIVLKNLLFLLYRQNYWSKNHFSPGE